MAAVRSAFKPEFINRLDDVIVFDPLDPEELSKALARYPESAKLVWVQEEPFNMGAWYYLRARYSLRRISCVSRPESASPATGSAGAHRYEQQLLMDQAFGDAPVPARKG